MSKQHMSVEDIKLLISCDPESGRLTWKPREINFWVGKTSGGPSIVGARFNSKHAGREAFGAITRSGYKHGRLLGKSYYAHCVVWAIHNGSWADDMVDHIDGNKLNNSIHNLRPVDNSGNLRNAKLRVDNTSGQSGVYWYKRKGLWHASIANNGRSVFLGYFDCLDDAIAARKAAESKYNYHPNHGRLK